MFSLRTYRLSSVVKVLNRENIFLCVDRSEIEILERGGVLSLYRPIDFKAEPFDEKCNKAIQDITIPIDRYKPVLDAGKIIGVEAL